MITIPYGIFDDFWVLISIIGPPTQEFDPRPQVTCLQLIVSDVIDDVTLAERHSTRKKN